MKLEGRHVIKYTIAGERGEVEVEVELKQIDELGKPFQNIWYGVAFVNEKEYYHPDLPYCVDAQFMAERIALDHIKELRGKHGPKLRVKRK